MKNTRKNIISFSCLIFILAISFSLFMYIFKETKNAYAESAIETPATFTVNAGDIIDFDLVKNWQNKTLVFEIKTDGTETQFQLRKQNGGGSGIIRTKPDRGIDTADEVAFENETGTTYWNKKCYSLALDDGWYRWSIKLNDLKLNDIGNDTDCIKCLKGTNVQIRNITFYDEIYADAGEYGYLNNAISPWRNQIVQFDLKLSDNVKRRFQVCKDSNSGISGLIVCTKTSLTIENPNYVSGDPLNPYWIELEDAPVNIGGDWYRFKLDLSKIKMNDGRTGEEIFDRFKNLPEKEDEYLPIVMKNFKIYYDPLEDTDIILEKNNRTNIPDIENWGMSTISFEVYYDSLDRDSDPQFVFGEKGKDNNVTGFFGLRPDVEGLYVRTTSTEGYWAEAKTQPVELENGWYKWVIDLSELKDEGGDRTLTIGNIFNRGNYDVYIRNFEIVSSYNPLDEESVITLKAGARTNIPEVELWSLKTISFELYGPSLDLNSDPQFIFGKVNSDTNVSGYFGYIKDINKLYLENANEGNYWLECPTQPEELESGWYKWVIDLSNLKPTAGAFGSETLGNIYNRGINDVYIKNFKVESNNNPSTLDSVITLKSNERTQITDVPNWGSTVISFEMFKNTLDAESDPQFIFGIKDSEKNATGYFGFKKNQTDYLYVQNANEGDYWLKVEEPEFLGNGWYKWTIDLSQIKAVEGASGAETIGNIFNRGSYDVYIRNLKIESTYDPSLEEGVIVLKSSEKTTLPITIPYWQYSTISFDVYFGSLDTSIDPQFQLYEEGSDKNSTGFFGYKQIGNDAALWVRNVDKTGNYWVKSTNQPQKLEKGWYRFTINLSELGVGENTNGTETLGKMLNRGGYDVYIKNFNVSTPAFVLIDQKSIIVPFEEGITKKINASIIGGEGEIEYISSDETVAKVDNKGVVTLLSAGKAEITVKVKDNDEIISSTCKIQSLLLKDYKLLSLDELTGGEKLIDFPLITSLDNPTTSYEYEKISDDNPSVVLRFLLNVSYLEQNRQAITIWGAKENPLYDGGYGLWAACHKGAFVFDVYGSNGEGGIFVSGINTSALNNHNTLVQSINVSTDYFVEAGAIDVSELIDGVQYTYFFIKVNSVLVWSSLEVASNEYRNPIIAFTADGASRAKAKKVEMVNVNVVVDGVTEVIEVADGLNLPKLNEPKPTDDNLKFIGWKKEDGTIWNYDRDKVDGEMTLTAVITSEFYTVNFDVNYNDIGIIDTYYVGYNMQIKPPVDEPVRPGYRFKWWSKTEDGESFNFSNVIDSDLTLYAVWVKTYKVTFEYNNEVFLTEYYDELSNIKDPQWGYQDNYVFGRWKDRGMFKLNEIANGRAPYFSLTENGERIDFDKTNVTVTGDVVVYICFMDVETVKDDGDIWNEESPWDYVSIRDLDDSQFKTDEYYFKKYDTSTAEYVPSKNNNTGSIILRGEIKLGDKFKLSNVNIGNIGLRSSLNVYNSISIWLRTKEVYLETKDNGRSVHLAFQSFENVQGIDEYLEYDNGVAYLKTDIYIPIEYGILAVTTKGFEDYDRVYFKIADSIVFDVYIPKYGKSAEGISYRCGFVTDGDTATRSALSIKGVYPSFDIEFLNEQGETIGEKVTISKYSKIDEPTYKLENTGSLKFVGWYDKNTKFMWNFDSDRVTSNMILVPTYGYTITLDPNEGGFSEAGLDDDVRYDPREQKVGDGCKIKFPQDPIREDEDGYEYVFIGWLTEDGTIWDKDNDLATKDLTLYAGWEIHISITFYVEDETFKWDQKTVKKGSIVGRPKYGDPDSYDAYDDDEHEFLGWFIKNEKGEFEEVNLNELVANENINVFALFDNGEDEPTNPNVKRGCKKGFGCSSTIDISFILLFIISLLFMVQRRKKYIKK